MNNSMNISILVLLESEKNFRIASTRENSR